MNLHIDLETYSEIDIKLGVSKYVSCPFFKIQLLAYGINNEPVEVLDLENGDQIPELLKEMLRDKKFIKKAYNANFEITCLNAWGIETQHEQWQCVSVRRATCGLPPKLDHTLKALESPELKVQGNHVSWFSKPYGSENVTHQPYEYPEKWAEYVEYNRQDVVAERWLDHWLDQQDVKVDWDLWHQDYEINTNGIRIDKKFCECILKLDNIAKNKAMEEAKKLTGLPNPNSLGKLKQWIMDQGVEVDSLTAAKVTEMLEGTLPDKVRKMLKLRQATSNTSTAKFDKMLKMEINGYIYHTMQFYGAHTGRWAARGIQPHNMPRMGISERMVGEIKLMVYDGIDPRLILEDDILKQMIRPTLIPTSDKFVVADFSAIEARVLAWLAEEQWAMDVFAGHGKIYEAQASMMYNIPIEDVDKDVRAKGKVAVLALGYQGGPNALTAMGFEGSTAERQEIVDLFRKTNKNITALWHKVDRSVKKCIKAGGVHQVGKYLQISRTQNFLNIKLPSGHILKYYKPSVVEGQKGDQIVFWGTNSTTKQFCQQKTYGGRLVENIVQAIARDCLVTILKRLKDEKIVFHVHDEIILEKVKLKKVIHAMESPINWAKGLVLKAEGYVAGHFRKD